MSPEQAREIVVQDIISYCVATFVDDEQQPGSAYAEIGPDDWAKIHKAVAEIGVSDRDLDAARDVLAEREGR